MKLLTPYKKQFFPIKENKNILKEFIVNDISQLKKYLEMSDEDNGIDLLNHAPYILDTYVDNIKDIIDSFGDDSNELNDFLDDMEWTDVIPILKKYRNNSEVKNLLKKIGGANPFILDIEPKDIPSWYFLIRASIVKNQWLIHFTDSATLIEKRGFDNLVSDLSRLGLTRYSQIDMSQRSKNGYGFSYLLSDYIKYGKSKGESLEPWKYGKEAVIFRASGLRCYHRTDEEYQVIFKGDTAKDLILIRYDDKTKQYFIKSKKTNEIIIKNASLEKLVDWIIKNYDQYRGHI